MNLNTRKKNGFTMIELIAVIVILGILAAAAVPRFMDARDDAEVAVAEGIAASWLSECNMRVAAAMLNPEDDAFACPTGDGGSDTAGAAGGDDWFVELGDASFTVTAAGGTSGDCTLTFVGGRLPADFDLDRTFTVPTAVATTTTGG